MEGEKREGRRAELRGAAGASKGEDAWRRGPTGGWGTKHLPESWLICIPGEPLGPPATPRVGRKLSAGPFPN